MKCQINVTFLELWDISFDVIEGSTNNGAPSFSFINCNKMVMKHSSSFYILQFISPASTTMRMQNAPNAMMQAKLQMSSQLLIGVIGFNPTTKN